MAKRASIKDVASYAGVSYQTVSRVINNKSDVASETRSRVLSAIEALKYRPSLAAQVFAHQRTMIIGVAIPYNADFLTNDHNLLQKIIGIDHEASIRDYSIMLSTARSKNDDESSYRRFLNRHVVDGIIVDGGKGEAGARILMEQGYPVVITGYNSSSIPSVSSNEDDGKYNGAQHLIALGHRRIGLISGPPESSQDNNPMKGCIRAMQDAGLPTDAILMAHGDFTVEGGYRAIQGLMQSPNLPTAIVAGNDAMAMGAIRWLQEHNYRVPEDISVIGYDDIPSAQYFQPQLTTLRQFSHEIGRRTASLLFELIEGHELSTNQVFVPTQLIVRASTAIAPDRH